MNRADMKTFSDAMDITMHVARLEGENKRLKIENERLWKLFMADKSNDSDPMGEFPVSLEGVEE